MSEVKTSAKDKKTDDPRVTGKPVIIPDEPHSPSQEEIAALAYDLWIERGSPDGSHESDWYEAEAQLRAEKPLNRAASA